MNRAQRRQAARRSRKAGGPGASAPPPVRRVAAGAAGPGAHDIARELETAVRLHGAGDAVNAAQHYQRVLAAAPDHPEALNYLGLCAVELGQLDTGLGLIARSLELHPKSAPFHNNHGNVLKGAGRAGEAVAAYRRAVAIDPRYAVAWNNLGITLAATGQREDAARAFRRAIKADSKYAEAHNNLGNVLHILTRYDEAEAAYRRAIALQPGYYMAYNNLANTLALTGRIDDGIAACRRAVEIEPGYAGGHNTLASLLQAVDAFAESRAHFRRALDIDPGNAASWNNYGNAVKDFGEQGEAIAAFRKALEINPRHATAHSNLLFCMGMDANSTARDIYAESLRWNEMHAAPRAAATTPAPRDPDPGRRLRVGYVSPDFRDHAVSHFVEPLFAARDRDAFELFAYADIAAGDAATDRFRGMADGWCESAAMTHSQLVERIRADGIDILIDLAGHTASNRLAAFAGRAAPVQATWLGYGGTTGLDEMDWRVTDAVADPEGEADTLHSEALMRLPGAFLCYGPPRDAPDPGPLPADEHGHVTFGSFNNLCKVTPAMVALWSRALQAVPGSRMIVKGRPFADDEVRRHYLELFAAGGVEAGRVELVAQLPSRREYLELYRRVDMVLDTHPYSGATTSCEAMWMGVPVITLAGDRHVSRMAASILAAAGAAELICASGDDYVAKAGALAGDHDRLAGYRNTLRGRMQDSPLCDAAGFARAMEAAYREMWRRRCEAA